MFAKKKSEPVSIVKAQSGIQRSGSAGKMSPGSPIVGSPASSSGRSNSTASVEGRKQENFGALINTVKEENPNVSSEPNIDVNDQFFQRTKSQKEKEELNLWMDLLTKKTTEKSNIKLKDDQTVFKEGWLTKEGRLVKSWKKRWFILSSNTLSYYTAKRNKLKGSITLDTYSIRIATDRPDGKECLELASQAAGQEVEESEDRILFFDAETPQDRKEWFVAINNKISLLRYQKKMRANNTREDYTVVDFFERPGVSVLDLTKRLDQEALQIDAIIALKEPIRYHSTLKKLILKNSKLGDEGLKELSECLAENSSIESLDLSGCGITAKGIEHFRKVIEKNKTLKDIDFSMNGIDDAAMKTLSAAVGANPSSAISRLCFNNNSIGDEGIKAFTEMLAKRKQAIHVLEFKNNNVGDTGIQDVAKLLELNLAMTAVEFGHNKISNDGAKFLADGLMKNTNIKTLGLENNEIGYRGTKDLAFMIVKNANIEKLVIGGNRLGEQALYLLANTSMTFPALELASM